MSYVPPKRDAVQCMCRDNKGRTPLMHAAHAMFEHCTAELLKNGASAEIVDGSDRTALHHCASSEGPVDAEAARACGCIIVMLLEAGIHVRASLKSVCGVFVCLGSLTGRPRALVQAHQDLALHGLERPCVLLLLLHLSYRIVRIIHFLWAFVCI
jgi:hypothetical protein